MSRTIKFRAWDKKQKKMLYGVSIGTIKVWDENAPLISHEFSYSEDCIFEQYTGLTDKNGKEIYEGDIVKARWYRAKHARLDTKGEVRFDDGWFCIYDDPDGQDRIGVPVHNCYSIEIIGNIHENPELLGDINVTKIGGEK